MTLIDATDRFAARREAARRQSGQFGEQAHSAPELTLVPSVSVEHDPTQSLDEILDELDEYGLGNELSAPETDTFTGTQEQRDHDRRVAALNSLLADADIDRDKLSEKTLAEIQDGMYREEQQKASYAAYAARQADLPDEDAHELPIPRTPADHAARNALTQIVEARGDNLSDYYSDSIEHIEKWAREEYAKGTLDASVAEEVANLKQEREERDEEDRSSQIASLGDVTDEVWDEALTENRLRAQQRIRGYRPTNYVNLKETNQLIRGDLKESFGKHKFSVVGDSYAGGASTRVTYVDGPPEHEVKSVADAYQGSFFDGMVDMSSSIYCAEFDADGIPRKTHYSPDHVFTRREFSEDVTHEAEAFLIKAYADQGETFDPSQRGRYLDPPQALYNRVGDAERETGVFGYRLRGGDQSAGEMVAIASTLIADERWAKSKK